DLRVVIEHEARVDQLAVDAAGQRGLAQPRADAAGDLVDRDRLVEIALAAVRQRDGQHGGSIIARKLPGPAPPAGKQRMVGASGIEPPTTSMSRKCSTTELRACVGARKIPYCAPR